MVATVVGGIGSGKYAAQLAQHAPLPERLRDGLMGMSEADIANLCIPDALWDQIRYDWAERARPEQIEPINPGWLVWLILAGRGWGKTRTGAEWIRRKVERDGVKRLLLVGRTAADVRDAMIEGESGLLSICPPDFMPEYHPTKRRLSWPNGATALIRSADAPNSLRGPQAEAIWCDELAAWRYAEDAWSNMMFGLRSGAQPQVVVTTTPRPVALVRELLAQATTVVDIGSSYANRDNLTPIYYRTVIAPFENTRLGRQEIHAELLDDAPGALWKRTTMLDPFRVAANAVPDLTRIVVGVDPAASSGSGAAETGIIAAGHGTDGHAYILDDRSLRASPHEWAKAAVALYRERRADRLVAEVNNGGEMVGATIRTVDPTVAYKPVRASRGKAIRAEPVAALYEQGRAHHVGQFPELEDQLCTWEVGDPSPDRLDALVWALTELMLDGEATGGPQGLDAVGPLILPLFPKANVWA